jgi:hypothetical protein
MSHRFLPVIALIVASLGVADAARASSVLVNAAGWVEGSAALTDDFQVAGPGTLTVTLEDYVFPSALSAVQFDLYGTGSAAPHLMGTMSGAGQESFQVNSGMRLSAQLYAVAGGAADIGLYGWKLTFTPQGAPVPLPSTGGLLIAGLVILGWIASGRRRTAA